MPCAVFNKAESSSGRRQRAAERPAITTGKSPATSPSTSPKSMLIVWGLCGFAGKVHFSLHTAQLTESIEEASSKVSDHLHQMKCSARLEHDITMYNQG